jgi:hypothetical protein
MKFACVNPLKEMNTFNLKITSIFETGNHKAAFTSLDCNEGMLFCNLFIKSKTDILDLIYRIITLIVNYNFVIYIYRKILLLF